MNGLSVLKLFQRSNGDLKFSEHAYSIYKVRKPRMTELGQGVGVRAHYPIQCIEHKGVSKHKEGTKGGERREKGRNGNEM